MTKRCETNENDVFQTNWKKNLKKICFKTAHFAGRRWRYNQFPSLPNAGLIHFFYYNYIRFSFIPVYNVDVLWSNQILFLKHCTTPLKEIKSRRDSIITTESSWLIEYACNLLKLKTRNSKENNEHIRLSIHRRQIRCTINKDTSYSANSVTKNT